MSRMYRPTSGTEGEMFIGHFCRNCIHGKYEHTRDINDKPCEIISFSFMCDINDKDYPEEWIYDDKDKPTCTAFVKWDWNKDDDGNWIEPPITPPDDPNQLTMPFLFHELEIPKIKYHEQSTT